MTIPEQSYTIPPTYLDLKADNERLRAVLESIVRWYDGGASPLNLHELLAAGRAAIGKPAPEVS